MRFKWVFFPLALWATARFCHHQTDGFRLSKIQKNTSPFLEQLPASLNYEEKAHLDQLLNQCYVYLGRGKQSFAFVSEDGQTVLKLFNNRIQRKLQWFPSKKANHKLEKTFKSYQIANDALKNETGILYFHPQMGRDSFSSVTIIDRLHIAHKIDLNNHGFLLQKRAVLPYDYLRNTQQTEAQKKEAVRALVVLLRTKMQRGIADHDPLIRANVGFNEGLPIQIDVGSLTWDASLTASEKQTEALQKMTRSFKHWLECHYPELVQTLDEAILG